VRLGLRANLGQFALLVFVNALVGAMVGMERTLLPAIAEQDFRIVARTAALSFIAVFGVSKAFANLVGGHLADRLGRRPLLILGWVSALPVPVLLMWAPRWEWVLVANVLLGLSQGLAWSMTVLMKIDLVGAKRRGLAMGLNEFAGYLAVAGAAWGTGVIATQYGLRPTPFVIGLVCALLGLVVSVALVRDTTAHVRLEDRTVPKHNVRAMFWMTTVRDRNLSSLTQVGLVNNLNDAMMWGLLPIVLASAGLDVATIAAVVAIYPATWGVAQLGTGALSDRIGRKRLIVGGMLAQAIAIVGVGLASTTAGYVYASVLLGLGTAAVYPTLLAAIGDSSGVASRGVVVGVYRFWRDMGYAFGAVISGVSADLLGLSGALWIVAALTAMSGIVAAVRLSETMPAKLRRAASATG
jgi:MFS family permease